LAVERRDFAGVDEAPLVRVDAFAAGLAVDFDLVPAGDEPLRGAAVWPEAAFPLRSTSTSTSLGMRLNPTILRSRARARNSRMPRCAYGTRVVAAMARAYPIVRARKLDRFA
jgi:hypothetical protein